MRKRATIVWTITIVLLLACGPILKAGDSPTPKTLTPTIAQSETKALRDSEVKSVTSETKRLCPGCEVFVTDGQLLVGEDPKGVVVIFVKDSGSTVRLARIITNSGVDVVFVILPGGLVDLKLNRFLRSFK